MVAGLDVCGFEILCSSFQASCHNHSTVFSSLSLPTRINVLSAAASMHAILYVPWLACRLQDHHFILCVPPTTVTHTYTWPKYLCNHGQEHGLFFLQILTPSGVHGAHNKVGIVLFKMFFVFLLHCSLIHICMVAVVSGKLKHST